MVSTDPNQGQPEFEQGSPEPSVSEVRIRLEQPISQDLADRAELLKRRDDILTVLSRVVGRIDGDAIRAAAVAIPPRPVTGRAYSSAYSPAYG